MGNCTKLEYSSLHLIEKMLRDFMFYKFMFYICNVLYILEVYIFIFYVKILIIIKFTKKSEKELNKKEIF